MNEIAQCNHARDSNAPLSPRSARPDQKLLQLAPFLADDQSVTTLMAQQGIVPAGFFRLLAPKSIEYLYLAQQIKRTVKHRGLKYVCDAGSSTSSRESNKREKLEEFSKEF